MSHLTNLSYIQQTMTVKMFRTYTARYITIEMIMKYRIFHRFIIYFHLFKLNLIILLLTLSYSILAAQSISYISENIGTLD